MRFTFFFFFVLFRELSVVRSYLSCIDDAGKPVDWFITYKLPKLDNYNPKIEEGEAYFYLGPDDLELKLSSRSIVTNSTAIGATLSPIYTKNFKTNNSFFVAYNDESPSRIISLYRGHTKGVLAFDSESGFWLVHSVPKFPSPVNESYSYPDSGLIYGQSFLCISLDINQVNNLSSLLYYNDPCVYDYYLPDEIVKRYPLLEAIIQKKHVPSSPWNETLVLRSRANFPFHAFAKFKNFDKDLYSRWLAPYFMTDLYTETWQNGPNKLNSSCTDDFTVENVLELTFDSINVNFKSTHDHSKIAISKKDKTWICIGDINRTEPQKRRGGGTVCMNSPTVWKLFHQLVSQVESCSRRRRL